MRIYWFLPIVFLAWTSLSSQGDRLDLSDVRQNVFVNRVGQNELWVSGLTSWNFIKSSHNGSLEISKTNEDFMVSYVQSNVLPNGIGEFCYSSYEGIGCYNKKTEKHKWTQIEIFDKILKKEYHLFKIDTTSNEYYLLADGCLFIGDPWLNDDMACISRVKSRRFSVDFNEDVITIAGALWKNGNGLEILKINKDNMELIEYDYNDLTLYLPNVVTYKPIFVEGRLFLTSNYGLIEYDHRRKEILDVINFDDKLLDACIVDESLILCSTASGLNLFDIQSCNVLEIGNKKISSIRANYINVIDDLIFLSINNYGVLKVSKTELFTQLYSVENPNIMSIHPYMQKGLIVANENGNIEVRDSNYNVVDEIDSEDLEGELISLLSLDFNVIFILTTEQLMRYDIKSKKQELLMGYNNDYFRDVELSDSILTISSANQLFSLDLRKGLQLVSTDNDIEDRYSYHRGDIIKIKGDCPKCYLNLQDSISEQVVLDVSYDSILNQAYITTTNSLFVINEKEIRSILNDSDQCSDLSIYQAYPYKSDNNNGLLLLSNFGVLFHNFLNRRTKQLLSEDKIGISKYYKSSWLDGDDYYYFNYEGLQILKITDDLFRFNNDEFKIDVIGIVVDDEYLKGQFYMDMKFPSNTQDVGLHLNSDCLYCEDLVNYKFRINNSEKWSNCNNDRINLYNVGVGNNIVEVMGIDFLGNKSSFDLSFTILPPYHQTWWFRSTSVLGLLGLGFGFNHLNTKRKLKAAQIKLDQQAALSAQREKIADDLHDELGTELSKILYLSDEATETKDAQKKEELVHDITNLAASSITNMRDMLWVLEQKNDTLESLLVKIRSSVQQTLKDYPIKVDFKRDGISSEEMIQVSGEIRQQILLIVKEAIHNVIKHAEASEVVVRSKLLKIDKEHQILSVSVQDNGTGSQELSEFATKGRGLASMRKRAEQIDGKLIITSELSKGTTIKIEVDIVSI